MKRKIISIDEEKCTGCGLCIDACHEGALQLVNGKAKLVSESYCDGLGDCLPECPAQAIKIEEREAEAYDQEAVDKHLAQKNQETTVCACPSAIIKPLERRRTIPSAAVQQPDQISELGQWPCQIKLAPINAPYFNGAKLLIAADCTAFAYANIHSRFMRGKITLIGCPKLDGVDYTEKLTGIIQNNDIKRIDVLRMSVPCCGGIENAVKQALINSGKMIPWGVTVIDTDGEIIEQ